MSAQHSQAFSICCLYFSASLILWPCCYMKSDPVSVMPGWATSACTSQTSLTLVASHSCSSCSSAFILNTAVANVALTKRRQCRFIPKCNLFVRGQASGLTIYTSNIISKVVEERGSKADRGHRKREHAEHG